MSITFRVAAILLRVLWSFIPYLSLLCVVFDFAGSSSSTGTATFSSAEFECSKDLTVLQLKIEALCRLGYVRSTLAARNTLVVDEAEDAVFRLLEDTRLRVGEIGVPTSFVLQDENVTVTAAGLRDDTIVTIERSRTGPAGQVKLRCYLVQGNDTTTFRHNPQQPGERMFELDVLAATTMTIADLRDLVGQTLLQYVCGWSIPPPVKTTATASTTPGKKVILGSLGGAANRTPPTLTIQTVGKKKTIEAKKESDDGVSYTYNSLTGLTPSAPSSSSSSALNKTTSTSSAATAAAYEDMSDKWRLRRTNAHAEAMELLEEVESVAGTLTHPN